MYSPKYKTGTQNLQNCKWINLDGNMVKVRKKHKIKVFKMGFRQESHDFL